MPHHQLSDCVSDNIWQSLLSRLGTCEPAIHKKTFSETLYSNYTCYLKHLKNEFFQWGYLFHFHVAVGKVNACFHNGETFNVRLTRSRAAQIIWYICPNTNDILLEFFCFLLQWNFSKIQTDSVSILINPFIKQAQQSKIHFLALLELSENKMRFSGPGAPGLSRGREVHQSGSQ